MPEGILIDFSDSRSAFSFNFYLAFFLCLMGVSVFIDFLFKADKSLFKEIFYFGLASLLVGNGIYFFLKEYFKYYHEQADALKNIAERRRDEWTDEFRRQYVAAHKPEILKDADEIKKKYNEFLSDSTLREYLEKYISPECVKMVEEPYKRLMMAQYGDLKSKEPAKKKTTEEIIEEQKAQLVKKAFSLRELTKARLAVKRDFEIDMKKYMETTRTELKQKPDLSDEDVENIMDSLNRELLIIKSGLTEGAKEE